MIYKDSPVFKRYSIKVYLSVLIFILVFIYISALFLSNPSKIYGDDLKSSYDEKVEISAESAVIINNDSGDILWEKNSDKPMYPASTTKMLSSIIAIERIEDFNRIVEISKNASGRNHSAFRFRKGDRISLMDLLKSSLIYSHNNAAVALAEYVSGNVEDFVELMNEKAEEIGAENSFFMNPNGLDDEFSDHKSTAEDLAIIASYCMENELFRELVNTKEDTIIKDSEEIEITNTNRLLDYNYIKGIKSGYTNNAGYCLVLYSEKNDLRLITVILKSDSLEQRDKDALELLDWAYDTFKYIKIIDSNHAAATAAVKDKAELSLGLYPETDYVKLVNINNDQIRIDHNLQNDIDLPVEKEEVLGSIDVFVNEQKVKEINMVSRESVEDSYICQELSYDSELRINFIVVVTLVFYFLVILFIIIRNLFIKKMDH
jgi:D-alanyl-D-alanine carboxypeptidase (penicillin-binding protein 5/6)